MSPPPSAAPLGSIARENLDKLNEGECFGVAFDQIEVFVVRHRQQLFGYLNRCPHLSIPLEWMPHQFLDEAKQYIQCTTHHALFKIATGKCIVGPCEGQSLTPVNLQQQADQYLVFPAAAGESA